MNEWREDQMKQSDTVLHFKNSILQHGHFNNRVYVMKLAHDDILDIIRFADEITHKEGYSKIFVKVPESSAEMFTRAGYITEAKIPSFYKGRETALFMAKYSDLKRKEADDVEEIDDIRKKVSDHTGKSERRTLPDGFSLTHAEEEDAEEIAGLFSNVFDTYPFPVSDPAYIRESMKGHIRYFTIKKGSRIAAISSSEIDAENQAAEMTDFATDPIFRGRGFARILLDMMEGDMQKDGILTAYTIARANSLPMNATFASAGYQFGGLLVNNTNIGGSIESMNIWYKRL